MKKEEKQDSIWIAKRISNHGYIKFKGSKVRLTRG